MRDPELSSGEQALAACVGRVKVEQSAPELGVRVSGQLGGLGPAGLSVWLVKEQHPPAALVIDAEKAEAAGGLSSAGWSARRAAHIHTRAASLRGEGVVPVPLMRGEEEGPPATGDRTTP